MTDSSTATNTPSFSAQLTETLVTRFNLQEPFSTPVLHLIRHPGKELRPALAYAVAEACGQRESSNLFAVAAAAELLHLAALVHDDLVDEASERRGAATVHRAFDTKTAVLVGDYLLAAAQSLLAEDASEATLRRLGPSMRVLAEAELTEFCVRGRDVSIETARKIAVGKAGSLFAWVATATAIECREWAGENAWQAWGMQLGLLYQLSDDLGDHLGIEEGKDTGRDAATETPTLLQALLTQPDGVQAVATEIEQLRQQVQRPPATGPKLEEFTTIVAQRAGTRLQNLLDRT